MVGTLFDRAPNSIYFECHCHSESDPFASLVLSARTNRLRGDHASAVSGIQERVSSGALRRTHGAADGC